ncbi:hypothetical protein NHG25_06325 [Aerococcaceae bacterium NML191292]|nr:hypothetical protein [Aerococcaceae bacterium NML191292]MCW6675475.1 hypothetical protein [Aerococcaceae bacterium NML171108]MCW6681817.1 hypothetical protein [Aerococcaceae bacterium NML160702]
MDVWKLTLNHYQSFCKMLRNRGISFGIKDTYLLIIIIVHWWVYIGSYWYSFHSIEYKIKFIILFLLGVVFTYTVAKPIGILLLWAVGRMFKNKHITFYFYPIQEKETIISLENRSSSKNHNKVAFPYESIKRVYLMYGGKSGYFSYKGKLLKYLPFPLEMWFYQEAFTDFTIDEWLDRVKTHNPNVKIKAYKHRFWMF